MRCYWSIFDLNEDSVPPCKVVYHVHAILMTTNDQSDLKLNYGWKGLIFLIIAIMILKQILIMFLTPQIGVKVLVLWIL